MKKAIFTHFGFLLALLVAVPSAASADPPVHARTGAVSMRAVDRSVAHIVAVYSTGMHDHQGARSRVKRNWAGVRSSHGTGTFINDGLILTARHVIEGSSLLFVARAGETDLHPAEIVYVDENRDLAFLRTSVAPLGTLTLPTRVPAMQIGERISTTGYPLSRLNDSSPAATFGEISREAEDGSIQTSLNVNPGNSGGPALNARDEFIGVVVRRADPREGGQGICFIEPLSGVLEAFREARTMARERREMQLTSPVIAALVRDDLLEVPDEALIDGTRLEHVRTGSLQARTPIEKTIAAMRAWCEAATVLEARHARDIAALPPADAALVNELLGISRRLSREALTEAPYITSFDEFAAKAIDEHITP